MVVLTFSNIICCRHISGDITFLSHRTQILLLLYFRRPPVHPRRPRPRPLPPVRPPLPAAGGDLPAVRDVEGAIPGAQRGGGGGERHGIQREMGISKQNKESRLEMIFFASLTVVNCYASKDDNRPPTYIP